MSTAQSFYLSDLEISTTATLATLSGAASSSFSGDAIAELDVSASVLQSLFQFHSDAIDVTDAVATDLTYKVVYTSSSYPLSADFLVNTVVSDGDIIDTNAATNTVPYDYVRYLAKKLFNTYLGVDLFANEEELRTDLDSTARVALDAKLASFCALGTIDASASINPSKVILDQIIQNQATRLSTLHVASGDANTDDGAAVFNYMPILEGDSLFFKLIVSADADQPSVVDSSTVSCPDRTYLIKINAVGANAWSA